MSHNLRQDLVDRIVALTHQGATLREIQSATGAHKNTISGHQKRLGIDALICGCGQSIRHRGWCAERYARSADRQEFMARWHGLAPPLLDQTFVGLPDPPAPPKAST